MGAEILNQLTGQGFKFAVKQGQLFVEPKHRLSDEARALIREHKAELLAVLKQPTEAAKTRTPFTDTDMDRIKAGEPGRAYDPVDWDTVQEGALGTSRTTEIDIANFYRKLFHGQAPIVTVTINDREVEEATQLGLIDNPRDQVVLAYRNLRAQTLIKIPVDRYDGLAILRLVSQG